MAVFFIEGPDRCGKSTQIKRLMSRLAREDIYEGSVKPIQWLHYSAVKNVTAAEQKALFQKSFKQMFELISENTEQETHWILDRTHLGDMVYSPMYRDDTDTRYVRELEREYIDYIPRVCVLLLFYDSSFNNLKRDDGDSLNSEIDLEKAQEELMRFRIAFDSSRIRSKLEVDIKDKTPDEVEQIVWDYVQKVVYVFPKYEWQKNRKKLSNWGRRQINLEKPDTSNS